MMFSGILYSCVSRHLCPIGSWTSHRPSSTYQSFHSCWAHLWASRRLRSSTSKPARRSTHWRAQRRYFLFSLYSRSYSFRFSLWRQSLCQNVSLNFTLKFLNTLKCQKVNNKQIKKFKLIYFITFYLSNSSFSSL